MQAVAQLIRKALSVQVVVVIRPSRFLRWVDSWNDLIWGSN